MPPLLRRLALSALVAATLAGCGSGAGSAGSGQAEPTTTPAPSAPAPPPTTAAPAPSPTSLRPPAPELGIVAARKRQVAPDLAVTAFDGRSVTLAGFRGQPVVVNFFESW